MVIHLQGGNDHFNTVVPWRSEAYFELRPSLALSPAGLQKLGNGRAFHGSLQYLAEAFRQGRLAVIESLSYPQPSRSHVRAAQIWQTASSGDQELSWLERYLSLTGSGRRLNFDQTLEPELWSSAIVDAARGLAAGERVAHLTFSGFDLHESSLDLPLTADSGGRNNRHADLLDKLDQALTGIKDLRSEMLVLIYTEFGRQLAENEAGGTEHGTKGTCFVLGPSVNGGFYGPPALSPDWLDFRTVYATILEHLNCDSKAVLGSKFASLDFLA